MLTHKLTLLIPCFALLFCSCAPGSYYLQKQKSLRNSREARNQNRYIKDSDQNISFYTNEKKNYYNDYGNNSLNKRNESNYNSNYTQPKKNTAKIKNNNVKTYNVSVDKVYIVKKGDNLFSISRKFNTTAADIAVFNNIKNRNKIIVGMRLKIPGPDSHKSSIQKKNKNFKKTNPDFIWPLKKIYGTERDGLKGVKSIGIIITGKQNTSVFSSADGFVTKVGHMRGFGNYIIVKHENKYLTIYSNLKHVDVNEGDRIKKGKQIGNLNGNKLHFQIGYAGKPEDPFIYLSTKT
ncbi:MAG: peptidoglycan DD-metalloendopeptidase family protein [Spirochaetes bacterium]|nr:peptidoglycan DD-metalloendopeptidase family protein [Spirochaetota bacterium]